MLQDMLEQLTQELGIRLIRGLLEGEAKAYEGSKHAKNPQRRANFWGEQQGYVYLGGKKVNLKMI